MKPPLIGTKKDIMKPLGKAASNAIGRYLLKPIYALIATPTLPVYPI
jgi:hypothetical protein